MTNLGSVQIICNGMFGFYRRLNVSTPGSRSWFSLAHFYFPFLTPRRNILFKDRTKNHFRPAFGLSDAHINALSIQVKIYASLVLPKNLSEIGAEYLGDKSDSQEGR